MARTWRRLRERRRAGSRGAVSVEAALIFPLVVFLTFGIVEFGSYWNTNHTLNESARAGARLGATNARELGYADDMVAEITDRLGALGASSITGLTIYKADPATGEPVTGTVSACTVDCYRYSWDPETRTFSQVGTSEWNALDQSACGTQGHNDYIGVYLEGSWESASGMFGDSRSISETSILRLEPVPLTDLCEP
jgi:Flp pilus assembly protein TadG